MTQKTTTRRSSETNGSRTVRSSRTSSRKPIRGRKKQEDASQVTDAPKPPSFMGRLKALRKTMKERGIDAFIVPSNDEYLGEYVPPYARRLEWLSSFTGSNGVAIILQDTAAFFTDGRYILQASKQVDSRSYERYDLTKVTPYEWAAETLEDHQILYFDPWLHTEANLRKYFDAGCNLEPVTTNPIDENWTQQPALPCGEMSILPKDYSGKLTGEKRKDIAKAMREQGIDYTVITAPGSVCWLCNIRGTDVPYTPIVHATAVLQNDGDVMLFIDRNKIPADLVEMLGEEFVLIDTSEDSRYDHSIEQLFRNCQGEEVTFQIDPERAPFWYIDKMEEYGLNVVKKEDPCLLPKACKNDVEVENAYQCHVKDGIAVTQYLYWIEEQMKRKAEITEVSAAAKLEELRQDMPEYQYPSFHPISAYGAHGAIIHYQAQEEKSNATIEKGGLYLIDSGGQYLDGTTDVTRTIAIGKPTDEQKKHYTLVLKGHIALAKQQFPEGVEGGQLDGLARQYLWNEGLDYAHGTGHGVGSYLNVHEGPQRISKRGGSTPLVPGMILSNEPGFYLKDQYGIRIENLVIVVEKGEAEDGTKILGFDTLTLVPFDRTLIDKKLLTKEEKEWINQYHEQVCEAITETLSGRKSIKTFLSWVAKTCKAL